MNLYEPATLRAHLHRHGLKAEKGLGQHFLCSKSTVEAIVAEFSGIQGILEIGPGPGVLTGPLSETAEAMVALEFDPRMIPALADSAPRATIFQLDALKADLASLLASLPAPRGIVSNLPYYITGPLLTRIAEARSGYDLAVLMMQKEVARRVLAPAKNSDRGSLSVFLQSQFDVKLVCHTPAGAFLPPPKVDSTVLSFRPRTLEIPAEQERAFFRLIRFGFAQPRKTLINNLIAGYRITRDSAVSWVMDSGFTENSRPQELSHEQWLQLHGVVFKQSSSEALPEDES